MRTAARDLVAFVILGWMPVVPHAQEWSNTVLASFDESRLTVPTDRRTDGNGFTPTQGADGTLVSGGDDRVGSVLPGVAWTPGTPGGGGGNGDPLSAPEPTLDDYLIELLPEGPVPGQASAVWDIAGTRDWAAGSVGIHNGCHTAEAPALWERSPSGTWTLHRLPGVDFDAEGWAIKVFSDGSAVGWDGIYSDDCLPAPGLVGSRPLLWEPLSPGVWEAIELPRPGTVGATARDAEMVNGLGRVIVGGSSFTANPAALLWRVVDGSWTVEVLGSFGGETSATGIDSAGVVVGYSGTGLPDAPVRESFVITPLDVDSDGVPDTWFVDSDGDGQNDLMQRLRDPGMPGGWSRVTGTDAAVGVAGSWAAFWQREPGTSWQETVLPADGFPEGSEASDLNRWEQVVGRGWLRRGEPRDRALLWDRDESSGDWTVLPLDDINGKPQDWTIEWATAVNDCGDIAAIVKSPDATFDVVLRLRTSPCE